MTYEWKNKVVLITGGAMGIGASVVRKTLEEGAKHVAVLDINEVIGVALRDELNAIHGANKVKFLKCDVTEDNQLLGAYETVVDENGHIDVVINNAGILNDQLTVYKKEIAINFTHVVTSTFKALELMRVDEGGIGGTVINVSSAAALAQVPYIPVYFGTKSAVMQFSNCIGLQEYYEKTGVRVIAICFGRTDTTLLLREKIGTHDKDMDKDIIASVGIFTPQKIESAANGIITAYKYGSSGSTWLSIHDKPAEDITPRVKKAFEILSENVFD